ncbi:hypothetical protein [Actinopolymorpha pittospori]|uniref:Glycoside hydrolase family 42 N-terminal domain-containing protein n=1 Tax=Actinopolymorpha pittospori TaxID=648752 RepID=A0A927N264_9ACTN|nr:hypothetical protein [Actinopolymorpha pittospori]MBE1610679.1 hypothetical protein [Actinopolymorpha pittospori]
MEPRPPGVPTHDVGESLGHSSLTRRGLMTLAGAGMALGALGESTAQAATQPRSEGGAAMPRTSGGASGADRASTVTPRILSGDRYPIGMWWPPHPFATNDARYREIAEAGFTFVLGGNYLNDVPISQWALAAAERAGLDFIPVDSELSVLTHTFDAGGAPDAPFMLSDAEAREGVRRALPRYPGPAFAGINLFDEPSSPKFATLAKYVAAMRELAPEALPYVNLLPSNDITYAREFVRVVAPSMVSFDRYPLLLGGDDPNWFDNLQDVRTVGLEAGIPYWVFIQSIKYAGHRMPTAAELRWQVGICLAYGYKGIQYFTYWTPDPARGEAFEPALVTVEGERTSLWYAAKDVNRALQAAGTQILPLTSQSVGVTAVPSPPAGLPAFVPDTWVQAATGAPVVIGQFAAEPDAATRTLIVTNYSHDAPAHATLTFGADVTRIELTELPGRRPPRTVSNPSRIRLAAGGFVVVRLTRG